MSQLRIAVAGLGNDRHRLAEMFTRVRGAGFSIQRVERVYTPVRLTSEQWQQPLADLVLPILSLTGQLRDDVAARLAALGLATVSDLMEATFDEFAERHHSTGRGSDWRVEGGVLEFMLDHGLRFRDGGLAGILRTPIDEVTTFPIRLLGRLYNCGIRWLELLEQLTLKELWDIYDVGADRVGMILAELARNGLQLRQ